MYQSLIYVSRSCLRLPEQAAEIDRIVCGSTERNAILAVRGALIFTERHFAQILEGPEASIVELMRSIERDRRHEQVTVIESRRIPGYRFSDWSLCYWGDASYMDDQVARVLDKVKALGEPDDGPRLLDLFQTLSRARRDQRGPIGKPSKR